MARLDDLVARVKDPQVRRELEDALAEMKRRRRFGLVYEEHIPEVSALHGFPVQLGSLVQRRDHPDDDSLYRVTALNSNGKKTTLVSLDGDDELSVPHKSLLVVKRFGDPIYPTLTP